MILDSCALLWIAYDKDRISSSTLELIQENPGIYISTALLKNLPVVTADKRFAEYGVKTLI